MTESINSKQHQTKASLPNIAKLMPQSLEISKVFKILLFPNYLTPSPLHPSSPKQHFRNWSPNFPK